MTNLRTRLEPVITPLFQTWWRLTRPVTLGVRVLARDGEGAVMLVRHSYAKGWHMPGGGVESGETAPDAAARELAEEAGLLATVTPKLFGFYANHANFLNDHIALYVVDAWRPCTPRGGNEIVERGFFALSALPDGITPGSRRRFAEVIGGAAVRASW